MMSISFLAMLSVILSVLKGTCSKSFVSITYFCMIILCMWYPQKRPSSHYVDAYLLRIRVLSEKIKKPDKNAYKISKKVAISDKNESFLSFRITDN